MGNVLKTFSHISNNDKHKVLKKDVPSSWSSSEEDLSTPTTHIIRPHEWYTKLLSCVKMMEQKYPNPPFHHSRLGLLIRDAFMNKMPSTFLCLLSPYSNRLPHALSLLNLAQNLYNLTSKESILKDFRLALTSGQSPQEIVNEELNGDGPLEQKEAKKFSTRQRSMEEGCYSYVDFNSENAIEKLKKLLRSLMGKSMEFTRRKSKKIQTK